MQDVKLTTAKFNKNGYWSVPISFDGVPGPEYVSLFDQNGYDLTELEKLYSPVNGNDTTDHRNFTHHALKYPWFTQEPKNQGAVLNHALIFERKGYEGAALEQMQAWTKTNALINKVARMRPKWGLDFSMDYADSDGNVFEVLHWEYDGFEYDEIEERKQRYELKFLRTDWDDAAARILKLKDQWHHLDFFAQSDWKCNYFGIEKERFKMVIWQ